MSGFGSSFGGGGSPGSIGSPLGSMGGNSIGTSPNGMSPQGTQASPNSPNTSPGGQQQQQAGGGGFGGQNPGKGGGGGQQQGGGRPQQNPITRIIRQIVNPRRSPGTRQGPVFAGTRQNTQFGGTVGGGSPFAQGTQNQMAPGSQAQQNSVTALAVAAGAVLLGAMAYGGRR